MTKREKVLTILLMVLLCGSGYYLFYYRPITAEMQRTNVAITQKRIALDEAKLRANQYKLLTETKISLTQERETCLEKLPEWFDDADILRRIQRIVFPHVKDVYVTFPSTGINNENSSTTLYTVQISFAVTYQQLQKILQDFERENINNRIVEYSINRFEGGENDTALQQVTLYVDYLTQLSPE